MTAHARNRSSGKVKRLCIPDCAEQTRNHVERPAKLEPGHVAVMERHVRISYARSCEHSFRDIEPLGLIPILQVLDVPAGAASDVEQALSRSTEMILGNAQNLLRFLLVILERVDLVVELNRIHVVPPGPV